MTDNNTVPTTCPKCGLINGFPDLFESCGVPKYGLQDSMMLNMQIRCEDRAKSYQSGLAQGRAELDAEWAKAASILSPKLQAPKLSDCMDTGDHCKCDPCCGCGSAK